MLRISLQRFAQDDSALCDRFYEINSLTSDFSSFSSAEIIYWEPLHNFPFSAAHANRERRNQFFLNAVTSVRTNGYAVPILARGIVDERVHCINNRVCSRAGG